MNAGRTESAPAGVHPRLPSAYDAGVSEKDFSDLTARLEQAVDAAARNDVQPEARVLLRSVQQQMAAIAKGDYETVLSQALPSVRLDIFAPPEFPWIRRAEGAAELRRAMEHNFSSVDDQRPRILDVFTEGDTVVLFGREAGRIRSTGQAYDVEFVEKFTFRGERLASVRIIAAHAAPGGDRTA